MWPLTVESQLSHFSQMCWRGRRPQISIKSGHQSSTEQLFGVQPCWRNCFYFSRSELVVEDSRDLSLTNVWHNQLFLFLLKSNLTFILYVQIYCLNLDRVDDA